MPNIWVESWQGQARLQNFKCCNQWSQLAASSQEQPATQSGNISTIKSCRWLTND